MPTEIVVCQDCGKGSPRVKRRGPKPVRCGGCRMRFKGRAGVAACVRCGADNGRGKFFCSLPCFHAWESEYGRFSDV